MKTRTNSARGPCSTSKESRQFGEKPWFALVILCAGLLNRSAAAAEDCRPAAGANAAGLSGAVNFSDVFEKVNRSVEDAIVKITALSTVTEIRQVVTNTTISRRLLGHSQPSVQTNNATVTTTTTTKTTNVGSGVIVDRKGDIVTSAHVVYGAETVQVTLNDGRHYPASLIGADPTADLAVIHIRASHLVAATFGDSSQLQVGQYVLDFGAPYSLYQSLTQGIISALHRRNMEVTAQEDPETKRLDIENEDFIQTDAPTDPGSSGGALVDLAGRVVGINESLKSSGDGSFSGVGFAIPANEVVYVVQQLIHHGEVIHGDLGLDVKRRTLPVPSASRETFETGLQVVSVVPDMGAEKAGLKPGDLIVQLNGQPVHYVAQLLNPATFSSPGTKMVLGFWRGNQLRQVSITIGSKHAAESSKAKQTGSFWPH